MAKKTEFYNTKWADPGYQYSLVCVYCGKTMSSHINHNGTYFWHCNCQDAQKEHEIQLKIQELKKQLPGPKYEVSTKVVDGYDYPFLKEIK